LSKRYRIYLALIALPSVSLAQAIDTNRPGFTSSPAVVARGQWQMETGLDYSRGSDSSRTWSLPVAEFRVGLTDRLEFFLNGISWTWQDSDQADHNGFKDMGAGIKFSLSGDDSLFSTALLGQLSVPVGDSNFTSDRWDPTVAFIWASNSDVPISGTVKISKFKSGYQLDNGLKWAFPIGGSVTTFIEWEANVPESGGNTHWMNLGYQLLRSSDTQLDINAGVGLTSLTDDYRLGVGFSHRF
jgi:hypothetical protein